MLDNLTSRLARIVKTIRGEARLTEANVQDALGDERIALLEADVALPVVKHFIDAVRAKAQAAGRRLSQSLYDQTTFDGIVYMSRITNRQCIAVYDRAVALKLEADSPALDLQRLAGLSAILDTLHITLEASA